MAKVSFTAPLQNEYVELFNTCAVRPSRAAAVDGSIDRIVASRARYEAVERTRGVPWHVVAVIHCMEASLSFQRHLHNGDPLTARTKQVPAGRPVQGQPPFTWEQSAEDALAYRRLGAGNDWSLAGTLYQLEAYNGWGYRLYHPHVRSPYLWSFSQHYDRGKYVADGTFSDVAPSSQCGAAVLLRRMAERGIVAFPDQPLPDTGQPLVVSYATSRPSDPVLARRAEELQRWLNTFPGVFVKPDGVPGPRTSAAFRSVTGHYLPGDPRS